MIFNPLIVAVVFTFHFNLNFHFKCVYFNQPSETITSISRDTIIHPQ